MSVLPRSFCGCKLGEEVEMDAESLITTCSRPKASLAVFGV